MSFGRNKVRKLLETVFGRLLQRMSSKYHVFFSVSLNVVIKDSKNKESEMVLIKGNLIELISYLLFYTVTRMHCRNFSAVIVRCVFVFDYFSISDMCTSQDMTDQTTSLRRCPPWRL